MDNILIYGTQYYRSPTPQLDQWERDMENIRELGFNTVKIWAQWRSNAPSEGSYDFSDIHRLMDIAHKNGLMVVINIIMDLAPAWLYRKYPESIMVLANGEKLYPQTPSYRQLGGAPGPCFHHKEAAELKYEFIAKLAEEFKDHPALLNWDLWNEPELTCGLARAADQKRMACYCDNSISEFRLWLKKKYSNIEKLNKAWQRNYQCFDEVEVPYHVGTYKDMIDWRSFFAETMTLDLKRRISSVKAIDKKHPVMVHTVPIPYFNMVNCCCDDYAMAKECDLYGNSIGNTPLMAAMTTSAAAGKTAISAELHICGGESFMRPRIQAMDDFRRYIYVPLARGIKGFMYWQFRAELCGREGPAWGLTDIAGVPGFSAECASRIGKSLLKYERLILDAKPEKSDIAIIRDYNNEIFTWCGRDTVQDYYSSLEGAFTAFYQLNYNVDVISTQQALDLGLKQYKLVYYPMPYYMTEAMAQCLKEYVRQGGMLVSEANFGAYRDEVNLHSMKVPGYGFDEVFGVHEGRNISTSSLIAAYGKEWEEDGLDKSLISMVGSDGKAWRGYLFLEELVPDTARVLGEYRDALLQLPVLTENKWEAGRAIMCGTLLGAAYALSGDAGCLEKFRYFAEVSGARSKPCAIENVRIDLLRSADGVLLVLDNQAKHGQEICLDAAMLGVSSVCEIESDVQFEVENGKIHIPLDAGSVRVYVGHH